MNPLNYRINDYFELEGIWSSNFSDKKVYGKLIHRSDNTTELKLYDSLAFDKLQVGQINILGKIKSDLSTYVIKAYIVSVDPINCLNYCQVDHFIILKDNQINQESKISAFDTFSFSFLHLKEWLPKIDYEYFNNSNEKGILFKNVNSEYLGNIEFKGKEYKLYIKKSIVSQEDHERVGFGKEYFNKISYEVDSKLEIQGQKISIEDAINICRKICGLFEILLDDYSKITYLGNSKCNVFPTYVYHNKNIDEHQLYFSAINYENINLPNIINAWECMNNTETNIYFHRLVANYLSDINNPSTLENRLLNITQGIEMYGADKKYPNLLCKLVSIFIKLPEEFLIKIAKSVESMIDFDIDIEKEVFSVKYRSGYKKSQTGKYIHTLDDNNLRKALRLIYFLVELKNTRVFLTHGTDLNKPVFKNKELKAAVTILAEVVRIFILLKLGVPENELQYSVDTLNNITKLSIDYNYDEFN
ncbi:hypothetical protein B8W86_09065 [Lactobacillus kefiranofaciens]|uniref:hypothetical protein n=1 Tax=Lactobacillus kefiranofaciens TaxID=267818 RepID=UPI000BA5D455|nr:hypothetical protein [Lactobacillus kefiranofaciens]PAK97623.1 hypothetical protein B8W86_09065 [Lactobacillus kefiranofaciens]